MRKLLIYNGDEHEHFLEERGVGFDEVIMVISDGKIIDIIDNKGHHKERARYEEIVRKIPR